MPPTWSADIDTSGILIMDYSGFKAVSIAAKDCAAPGPLHHSGAQRAISCKNPPQLLRRRDLPSQRGQGGALQPERRSSPAGGRVRGLYRAMTAGDQELCARMLDTSIAVSRVLTVARRSAGVPLPRRQILTHFSLEHALTTTRFQRFEYSPKTRKERAGLRRIRQKGGTAAGGKLNYEEYQYETLTPCGPAGGH